MIMTRCNAALNGSVHDPLMCPGVGSRSRSYQVPYRREPLIGRCKASLLRSPGWCSSPVSSSPCTNNFQRLWFSKLALGRRGCRRSGSARHCVIPRLFSRKQRKRKGSIRDLSVLVVIIGGQYRPLARLTESRTSPVPRAIDFSRQPSVALPQRSGVNASGRVA